MEMIVDRIEKRKGKLKMILKCGSGKYDVDIDKKTAQNYRPGTKLMGELAPEDEMSDFIGENRGDSRVATHSYEIARLKDSNGNILYNRKNNKEILNLGKALYDFKKLKKEIFKPSNFNLEKLAKIEEKSFRISEKIKKNFQKKKKIRHTILYAADLHGEYYGTLLERGAEKDINSIIIGGDILPKKTQTDGYTYFKIQEDFILNDIVPKFAKFKKQCSKPVYLMMGNDDFSCNMDLLEQAEKEGLFNLLHNKVYNLTKDMQIAGYGIVPLTPFSIKDWEKFDTSELPKDRDIMFDGYQSFKREGKFMMEAVNFLDFDKDDNIENDLENLIKKVKNPERTIFVTHAPPYDTSLDMASRYMGTKHVGSVAIRKFIEKYQPFATLHGHIHESQGSDKIGKTICINPGRSYKQLNAARFGF